jgi:hypothetical protein
MVADKDLEAILQHAPPEEVHLADDLMSDLMSEHVKINSQAIQNPADDLTNRHKNNSQVDQVVLGHAQKKGMMSAGNQADAHTKNNMMTDNHIMTPFEKTSTA